MYNLIKAEFYKQKANGTFKMYVILMFLVGIGISFSSISVSESIKNDWFWGYNNLLSNSIMINMIIATISAFYHVRDFNDKSIHHALMSGYTRKEVVFSKIIVFNIETILAFIVYLFSGMIIIFLMNGTNLISDYNVSIVKYIIISLSLKLLYLIALNAICMSFCYLVRNTAAYLLVIFSLWASFLGALYQFNFIAKNIILKTILKMTIMVQDQIMFVDRMGSGVYRIKSSEAIYFLCVVVLTIILFYQLTCSILKKVEIK